MAENLTYKILKKHLVSGELKPGEEIGIKIDQTLTQDATGTMAYLQLEAMTIDRVKTEISVSYVDHNTLQQGFENADDHRYLQSVAAKYGIKFSRPGNGVCHQVHLERFAKPGKTLLGSDSHTPTCGAMAMIAIGAGGLDVAVAMAGGPFYLNVPRVIRIELSGRLRKWVSAKDVILTILKILSTKGNVNTVLEYSGEGLNTLSIPERATIANMGAETGATTSIFPSDETTRRFLTSQERGADWQELKADEDAHYDKTIRINLADIVPMIALPHSPGKVVKVSEISGKKVDQVEIGSCTNSSLRDLIIAGEILKGNKVNVNTSLAISPGSRQVFSIIAKSGILKNMIDAGARIMESACGFCIGCGQAPQTNAVSLRTSNRNFQGRSGTKTAGIYLCSVETAALSAVAGEIVDPLARKEAEFPEVELPEIFDVDDSMIIPGDGSPEKVKIVRGPNIGKPPKSIPLADMLDGVVAIKVADKITTDHIMPAGEYLKFRSNIEEYSSFVFKNVNPGFAERAARLKKGKKAVFIVAGLSYGQGSSREHAALCPMHLGVKAVFAKSFERIHAANLINFGILPLVFVDPKDYKRLDAGDKIKIKSLIRNLDSGDNIIVQNKTKGVNLRMKYNISQRQKKILKAGGLLNYIKSGK